MDINEIREIIESDGGKFIIVENGKPIMVIVSFEEYKKRLMEKKVEPAKKEQKLLPKELESNELKLEDLPL